MRSSITFLGFGLVALLTLAACSSGPGAAAPTSSDDGTGHALADAVPAPPAGEVVGTGTVLDTAGAIELCLGPIMESYPPQCSGVPVRGWSWEGLEPEGQSDDTTWGGYAVFGTYDGASFTVTQPPVLLALYDPIALPDPTGGADGTTAEERLVEIQNLLPALLGDDGTRYFSSVPERGYLWVDVIWDDGTLQRAADAEFGDGVVVIRSALRAID